MEAARYQLGCWRPRQPNPPLTLQDLYSALPVKIQSTSSSRWPSFCLSVWMAVIETLAGLITVLPKAPRWGSDMNTTDWQRRLCPFTQTCILMYLFSTLISNGSSCTNWVLFPSPLSREPPWFNGTSKVRQFYFNTFKWFHCGSSSFSVCFTLRIGYLYKMSPLNQPSGEDVVPFDSFSHLHP